MAFACLLFFFFSSPLASDCRVAPVLYSSRYTCRSTAVAPVLHSVGGFACLAVVDVRRFKTDLFGRESFRVLFRSFSDVKHEHVHLVLTRPWASFFVFRPFFSTRGQFFGRFCPPWPSILHTYVSRVLSVDRFVLCPNALCLFVSTEAAPAPAAEEKADPSTDAAADALQNLSVGK